MSAVQMTLREVVTGSSAPARKFRAVCLWSDVLNAGRDGEVVVLEYAASVAFGSRPDHADWQEDLELRRGVAEIRGQDWFDDSQPWAIPEGTLTPVAYVPVPPTMVGGMTDVQQAITLDKIGEAVAPYGITN